MKLKKILIIFVILVVVLLAGFLIVAYMGYSKAKKTDSTATFTNYFPFGAGSIFTKTPKTIKPHSPLRLI
jgi:flagellar basal body-associated protein FliL